MTALQRKVFRNLYSIRSQAIGISIVVACGVGMSVMSISTLQSLSATRTTYYNHYRFGDIFASFRRGPLSLKDDAERISGVGRAEIRIVRDVNLIVPNLREPAVGRVISIPESGQPRLNRLYLSSGRLPAGERLEAVVSAAFAKAHGFQPGDSLKAVLNGRLRELRIVGIGLSPEYIVEMSGVNLLPDHLRFGVIWMTRPVVEAAFDMDGAGNNISVTLTRHANPDEVRRQLDNLLDPWGGLGSIDRDDQISHRFVSDEIRQLRSMGIVTPIIFSSVAAFLLHIVISRLIAGQRQQIAVLKAFGYYESEIFFHFLQLVSLIVLFGIISGLGLGIWMGHGLTELYTEFFRFPFFRFEFHAASALLAALAAFAAAIAGTAQSLRAASRLAPASAMRPAAPEKYKKTLLEKLRLFHRIPGMWRMVVRHLHRRPVKAGLSILGLSMAIGVLILGTYGNDALDFLIDFQFRRAQRQDLWVSLYDASPEDIVQDFKNIKGVLRVEPFRTSFVRITAESRSRRLGITGIDSHSQIYRLLATNGQEKSVSDFGIVVSQKLAEVLHVVPGQTVFVEFLEGKRRTVRLRISDTIDDLSGLNAYTTRRLISRINGESPLVSGVWMTVDQRRLDDVYAKLKSAPQVMSVNAREVTIRSFLDTIAENQNLMQTFVIGFAVVIAAAVVYNTARVILSERSAELSTMRILGFTHQEVSTVLLGELGILTVASIPAGLLVGYAMAWTLSLSLQTELYRIPLIIAPSTYVSSVLIVLASAVVSGALVRRRLKALDLFAVLKGQD